MAHGRRFALYPSVIIAIFGPLIVGIHQASLPYEYTCRDCGNRFGHRPLPVEVGVWLFRVMLLFILAIVVLLFVLDARDFWRPLP